MRFLFRLLVGVLVAWPSAVGAQISPMPDADPRIQSLVASVSEQRLQQLDKTLAAFRTRETLSDSDVSDTRDRCRAPVDP